MKKVLQTRFSGEDGNCWAACLASYFEVPLAEVDHCAGNHPDWKERTDAWLAARGLYYLELSWGMEGTLSCLSTMPDGTLLIAGVKTRSMVWHTVLVKASVEVLTEPGSGYHQHKISFNIVHDPHPGRQPRERTLCDPPGPPKIGPNDDIVTIKKLIIFAAFQTFEIPCLL